MTYITPRKPMNVAQRRIFEFFEKNPHRKPEDAVNENTDMDVSVVFNAVYFLYFNTYLLKSTHPGCYYVNQCIAEEEREDG